MRMYVANTSTMRVEFPYRIPESTKLLQQTIEPMSQVVLSPDLTDQQVRSIVEQYEKYGFYSADQVRDAKKPLRARTYLCYSIDKPVSSVIITALAQKNFAFVDAQGRILRQQMALAGSEAAQNAAETVRREIQRESGASADLGQMASFEVTTQEEFQGDSPGKPEADIVHESVHIPLKAGRGPRGHGRASVQ